MSSILSICRTALQTAAQGIAPLNGTPDQVVLGDYNWAAGSDFFANIQTTGPWLFVKPTSGKASGVTFNGNFQLKTDLVYGFDDNANFDWTAIEDIIAALVEAWVSYSEFVKGGVIGPFELEWKEPDVKPNPKAGGTAQFIARTVFTFTFAFVADQGVQ